MTVDPGGTFPPPLASLPVRDLLEDVATGSMAPGGMSMAALSGATAAALAGLVGHLTAGKPGYEPMTEEMERLIERARVLHDQVLTSMDQEVAAFNKLVESMGLPRGSGDERDEQSIIRRDLIAIALRGYTQVPLQIGSIGMELVQLCETVIRYGNREVLADSGTGLLAALAAVKSASLHVLINLRGHEDEWATEAREKVTR